MGGATRLTAHAVPELAPVVDRYGRRYDGRKFWGQPFLDLIDHPSTLPVLREVLGDDDLLEIAADSDDIECRFAANLFWHALENQF